MEHESPQLLNELQRQLNTSFVTKILDTFSVIEEDERIGVQIIRLFLQQELYALDGQLPMLKAARSAHENREGPSRRVGQDMAATTDRQLDTRMQDVAITTSRPGYSHHDKMDGMPGLSSREKSQERAMRKALEEIASRPKRRGGRAEDATRATEKANTSKKMLGSGKRLDSEKEFDTYVFEDTMGRSPQSGDHTKGATGAKGKEKMSENMLGSDTSTTCCACLEITLWEDILTVECKPVAHHYCRYCHVKLFRHAIADPTLFPPKCCNVDLPLDRSLPLLPRFLVREFNLKAEELLTRDITYCSSAGCPHFLRSEDIKGDIGTCPVCGEETCVQCKSKSHDGLCQEDPHVQLLMDAAQRNGWQECTKCMNTVELSAGCYHMICRCKHEFCYACGVLWKRCDCPTSDGNHRVRRRPETIRPGRASGSHVCDLRYVNGLACDDCGADHFRFVMYCDGCQTASCWPCIHNSEWVS